MTLAGLIIRLTNMEEEKEFEERISESDYQNNWANDPKDYE